MESPGQSTALPLLILCLEFATILALAYLAGLVLTHLVRRILHAALPALRATARWLAESWSRSAVLRRWPGVRRWVGARLAPGSVAGLPLTIVLVSGASAALLLGELAEAVIEAEEVVRFDAAVDAAVHPYRSDAAVAVFAAITALGGTEGTLVVTGVASLLLWRFRRRRLIAPLWVSVVGAQLTTWFGKQIVGRPRPEFVTGFVESSLSFPSGHSTAALATFGFIAYVLARASTGWRRRFEVLFWFGFLIALIGFSRVFLGVHYASDVAAGFLVGSIWLLAGIAWLEWREEQARVEAAG